MDRRSPPVVRHRGAGRPRVRGRRRLALERVETRCGHRQRRDRGDRDSHCDGRSRGPVGHACATDDGVDVGDAQGRSGDSLQHRPCDDQSDGRDDRKMGRVLVRHAPQRPPMGDRRGPCHRRVGYARRSAQLHRLQPRRSCRQRVPARAGVARATTPLRLRLRVHQGRSDRAGLDHVRIADGRRIRDHPAHGGRRRRVVVHGFDR